MSAASNSSSLPFLLSRRAEAQRRNLHVFSLGQFPSTILVGGFDLKRVPLAANTFYRWLDLCDALINNRSDDSPNLALDVVLRRIQVTIIDVLAYGIQSVEGPPIPRESLALLEPGIYGIFNPDGTPYEGNVSNEHRYAYPIRDFLAKQLPDVVVQVCSELLDASTQLRSIEDHLPSDLIQQAKTRDQGRCVLTGRNDVATEVVWLFPPVASQNLRWCDRIRPFEEYRVLENVITLSSTLVDALRRNVVAVDVDDNNRIVSFEDIDHPQVPSHLPASVPAPTARFWRWHLQYTLAVFFPAGDAISSGDYSSYNADAWIDELDSGEADIMAPKWQTQYGQEVLEVFMRQSIWIKEQESRRRGFGDASELCEDLAEAA
ncbi:hypothetical protein HMN09_00807800 [Mycena chlorophos]|uniref:Uncharacterized protein n=1 Tax=Mycena chlorophos TaxID=658473 RepID=A0A8H6W4M3_MYCCL|nr:hypothetical protein HMN09_00807800 [Mycena chlorophos]